MKRVLGFHLKTSTEPLHWIRASYILASVWSSALSNEGGLRDCGLWHSRHRRCLMVLERRTQIFQTNELIRYSSTFSRREAFIMPILPLFRNHLKFNFTWFWMWNLRGNVMQWAAHHWQAVNASSAPRCLEGSLKRTQGIFSMISWIIALDLLSCWYII